MEFWRRHFDDQRILDSLYAVASILYRFDVGRPRGSIVNRVVALRARGRLCETHG